MSSTDLKDYIKEKRPTLSASSITTYNSILKNLYKNVFGGGGIDTSKFDDTARILAYLKNLPPNKRKTILSSLVIITDDKEYRELMLEDIKHYNQEIAKQEKSETQAENWVNTDEIKSLWDNLKRNADLLYKKKNLTTNDLQEIQQFIIISLLGGIFIAPRRSKDFCDFRIKNIDKSKQNYLDKNDMVFTSYKTSKFYGEQRVVIPPTLKSILSKWIKINPTDYLLFDTNMNPLSSVKLNQRLNKLFAGRRIGTNQMRHTYLTNKFGETIKKNKEIENTMSDMGSSSKMLTTYVKNDD
jgi:integrase